MENEYPEEIPTVHPFAKLTERDLSKLSFRAGDAVRVHAEQVGAHLTREQADRLVLRISDEVEKELRRIRRGE